MHSFIIKMIFFFWYALSWDHKCWNLNMRVVSTFHMDVGRYLEFSQAACLSILWSDFMEWGGLWRSLAWVLKFPSAVYVAMTLTWQSLLQSALFKGLNYYHSQWRFCFRRQRACILWRYGWGSWLSRSQPYTVKSKKWPWFLQWNRIFKDNILFRSLSTSLTSFSLWKQ